MAAPQLYDGNGAPNGVVFGDPGDLYMNTAGGAGTTFYVKESGVSTNTGWVAYVSSPIPSVQQAASYYNDFYTVGPDVSPVTSGTADVFVDDPQTYGMPSDTAGLLVMDTGGGALAQAIVTVSDGQPGIVLGHGVFDVTWRAATTLTLSGAANSATDYTVNIGANAGSINQPGLTFAAGIAATGNTHWWAQVVAGVGNAPPNVDTGVAVVANGMHTFRVVYDSTLVTPSAKFFIDGALVATITTSLPADLTVELITGILSSAASSHPKWLVDYVDMTYTFATPR